MTRIGKVGGLRFELVWEEPQPGSSAAEATRGVLGAWLGERVVWGVFGAPPPIGFDWTWIELLEHLAASWTALKHEEGDPFGLGVPLSELRFMAENGLGEEGSGLTNDEEHRLWQFEQAHDLAAGIQGAWLPSLWLLREGLEYRVEGRGARLRLGADEVLPALAGLGDAIAERARTVSDDRSSVAIRAWDRRDDVSPEALLDLRTGIPAPTWVRVAAPGSVKDRYPELVDSKPTEILAAARLLPGGADPRTIRSVIERVRQLERVPTAELDELALRLHLRVDASNEPWRQGYEAARAVREALGVERLEAVDPSAWLQHWRVEVRAVDLDDPRIDAIAVWGARHGPAVLLNEAGAHSSSPAGRRATLAHEIAHLLLDRTGALPLAEVLGGRVSREIEQRARAFAAELLLPTEAAAEALRGHASATDALSALTVKYGVSKELAAWQIRNSGIALSEDERARLRSHVSHPAQF